MGDKNNDDVCAECGKAPLAIGWEQSNGIHTRCVPLNEASAYNEEHGAPKVEIKKLTIVDRMSKETTCFVCDVWVDGKKAGTAENDGNGGSTFVRWSNTNKATADRVRAYGKTLCPPEYRAFTAGDEWLIDELVQKAQTAKLDAKEAKKVAKRDAEFIASAKVNGVHAARFKVATTQGYNITWVSFRDAPDVARLRYLHKHPNLTEWTVLA